MEDVDAVYERALILYEQDQYEKAITLLEQVLVARLDDIDVLDPLGYSYFQSGNHPASIDIYRKATKLEPEEAFYWVRLGDAYRLNEEYPSAVLSYRSAQRVGTEDATPQIGLAMVYIRLEDYVTARGLVEEARRIQPDHRLVPKLMGQILAEEGSYLEAVDLFLTAAERGAKVEDDLYRVAATLYIADRYDDLKLVFAQLDTFSFRDPQILFKMARVSWKAGERYPAEKWLDRALTLDPGLKDGYMLLIKIYRANREWKNIGRTSGRLMRNMRYIGQENHHPG